MLSELSSFDKSIVLFSKIFSRDLLIVSTFSFIFSSVKAIMHDKPYSSKYIFDTFTVEEIEEFVRNLSNRLELIMMLEVLSSYFANSKLSKVFFKIVSRKLLEISKILSFLSFF